MDLWSFLSIPVDGDSLILLSASHRSECPGSTYWTKPKAPDTISKMSGAELESNAGGHWNPRIDKR